jgi:hypothetical protein
MFSLPLLSQHESHTLLKKKRSAKEKKDHMKDGTEKEKSDTKDFVPSMCSMHRCCRSESWKRGKDDTK